MIIYIKIGIPTSFFKNENTLRFTKPWICIRILVFACKIKLVSKIGIELSKPRQKEDLFHAQVILHYNKSINFLAKNHLLSTSMRNKDNDSKSRTLKSKKFRDSLKARKRKQNYFLLVLGNQR